MENTNKNSTLNSTLENNLRDKDTASLSDSIIKSTFDVTYEGLIIIDDNFKILKVNNTTLKILTLSEDNLLNMNIKTILPKNSFLEDCIKNGKNTFSQDCTFNINNSHIRSIVNIMPIILENKIIGATLSLRNTKHIHKLVSNVVGYKASYSFEDIITKNQKMKSIIELAKKASESDCNILIEGNSGTGKELFAQAIHSHSNRTNGPFVAINCAAIPRELVESELFGYEKGAFTGASKGGYPGKFELADGGTIFLDEIGELPLDIQSKLLRVLDNLKIIRVGGTYEKKIDVRVIAATNRNLSDEVLNKNFREDLYYRLNVINIKLLDLKDRREDIYLLASYFIKKLNIKNNATSKKLGEKFIEKIENYDWNGNVRELRNVVERCYYICEDDTITEKYLNNKLNKKIKTNSTKIYENDIKIKPLSILEHEAIKKSLIYCNGNIIKSAELLGISRATIYRKINKYNIDVNSLLESK